MSGGAALLSNWEQNVAHFTLGCGWGFCLWLNMHTSFLAQPRLSDLRTLEREVLGTPQGSLCLLLVQRQGHIREPIMPSPFPPVGPRRRARRHEKLLW